MFIFSEVYFCDLLLDCVLCIDGILYGRELVTSHTRLRCMGHVAIYSAICMQVSP